MNKKLVAIIVCAVLLCAGIGYVCYEKGIDSQVPIIADMQAEVDATAAENARLVNEKQKLVNEKQKEEPEELYSTGDYWVDTQSDPLNIRVKAKQDSKRIGKIPKGANITITQTNGRWGYVTYGNKSGWVNLQYCTPGYNYAYEEVEYEDTESDTVYIARTGTVYHTSASCYHIAGHSGVRELSRDDAESQGYRKCYHCP